MTLLNIPRGNRVFILEDSVERIKQFEFWFPTATIARTREEAESILIHRHQFDVLFLDYELGPLTMCPDTGVWRHEAGTGVDVAKTLQALGHDGAEVIIHSLHKQGARDMKIWLPKARLLPFGTFEVQR